MTQRNYRRIGQVTQGEEGLQRSRTYADGEGHTKAVVIKSVTISES